MDPDLLVVGSGLFGLTVATVLTLVLVPAMFSLAEDFSAALRRRFMPKDESGPPV